MQILPKVIHDLIRTHEPEMRAALRQFLTGAESVTIETPKGPVTLRRVRPE